RARLVSTLTPVVARPEPRSTERGDLPKVYSAGLTTAAVLNQWLNVCSSEGRPVSPARLARFGPAENALVAFAAVTTVKAGPDCSVSSTPSLQPASAAFTYRLAVNGFTS